MKNISSIIRAGFNWALFLSLMATSTVTHALAADHGLLGLLTFGAILFATFRGLNRARRYWRKQRPDLEKMATGLEAALIAYLATSIFLHFAYIRYLWLVVGLAGAASYLARTEASERAADASGAQA